VAEPTTLTISILTKDDAPVTVAAFAKHMGATVRTLRAIDKAQNGKLTTEYYLTGFDIAANGVAYRVTAFPKGYTPRITNVDQNAPPLLPATPQQDETPKGGE
jgi:hypothetical protein